MLSKLWGFSETGTIGMDVDRSSLELFESRDDMTKSKAVCCYSVGCHSRNNPR